MIYTADFPVKIPVAQSANAGKRRASSALPGGSEAVGRVGVIPGRKPAAFPGQAEAQRRGNHRKKVLPGETFREAGLTAGIKGLRPRAGRRQRRVQVQADCCSNSGYKGTTSPVLACRVGLPSPSIASRPTTQRATCFRDGISYITSSKVSSTIWRRHRAPV